MDKVRVLFVDDDAAIRDVVRVFLEDAGFEVLIARSGQEALDLLNGQPCVVITDLRMPEMSGLELTERIRADDRVKDSPIILFTAANVTPDLNLCIIRKPSGIDELLAVIEEAGRDLRAKRAA